MSIALGPVVALAMLIQTAPPVARAPVLSFPEPGLDDTAAYQGYATRFYRDSRDNALQIYIEARAGRVVNLWADAANESLGFTARDARGRPAALAWGADSAAVWDSSGVRTVEYHLAAAAPGVTLGWFLLGSMRVERDFQYWKRHLQPFTAPPFYVAEESLLVANVGRLPAGERGRHLALLRAGSVAALGQRLQARLASAGADSTWSIRVERPSLDGLTHLTPRAAGLLARRHRSRRRPHREDREQDWGPGALHRAHQHRRRGAYPTEAPGHLHQRVPRFPRQWRRSPRAPFGSAGSSVRCGASSCWPPRRS